MSEHDLSRRTFVALTAAAVTGTAGCVAGSREETAGAGGGSPTATATATEAHSDAGTHEEDGHHEDDGHHEENTHHGEETETGHADESSDHGHGVPEEPSASATVNLVTADGGYHFDPHVVWVEPGGTVTFHNESGSHTATAYAEANDKPGRIPEGGTAFDTGMLTEAGAEHEVTLDTPGVYDYYCAPHEAMGMVATVVVGHPDAHEATGLTDPQSSLPSGAREKIRGLNETVHGMIDDSH
ncbi:plastocyanin/azurin family copper-binding protein [Halobaculum marinum]|uniref:Plastocyanin/azurin family copper-binding protein n=1 Tax=Halobaculum marinum TaxID=3031996 RepID=A0ABD5X1E8_9EURY|nr:plastocyanin/azurin family copper-binding protein [Halobaculum sp. DT55]